MTKIDPIPARLAALKTTSTPELKRKWRELFDSEPPPFNRRYLESRLTPTQTRASTGRDDRRALRPDRRAAELQLGPRCF